LFNGISCFNLASEKIGLNIDKIYTSEIDKYSLAIETYRFPNNIQLGDIGEIKTEDLPQIDLLIGGSPCTNFSFSGKCEGMVTEDNIKITSLSQYLKLKEDGYSFKGQSYLFFEYIRLLREINPRYFLLENVRMKKEYLDIISENIGVEPILINSKLLSAQSRPRYYWTNIPNITQPEDRGIVFKDISEDENNLVGAFRGRYLETGGIGQRLEIRKDGKSNCLTTVQKDNVVVSCKMVGMATDIKGHDILKRVYSPEGKSPTLTAVCGGNQEKKISLNNEEYRKMTPLEYERLQTIPDNYTLVTYGKKMISNSQRYRVLGLGFTVDIIAHILKNLKEGIENV